MIFKEMYQIITEDYLAVFLLILISAISYLGVNRFVRFLFNAIWNQDIEFYVYNHPVVILGV